MAAAQPVAASGEALIQVLLVAALEERAPLVAPELAGLEVGVLSQGCSAQACQKEAQFPLKGLLTKENIERSRSRS